MDLKFRSKGLFGVTDFEAGTFEAESDETTSLSPSASVSARDLRIVADVTLHNRDELTEALGLGNAESKTLSESGLLILAYERWGEDCGKFLLGEYAFAIWDPIRRTLFCCRDHFGQRAFLYWKTRSRFIFAGDIHAFARLHEYPLKVNRRKLAALAVPDGQDFYPDETFYNEILSLAPGSWLTVERQRTRHARYWEPRARIHAIPRRPEEAYEGLREILFRAVECRLDPDRPVAAMLSGGLDSSGVVSIASRCLATRNRELTAFAAVLPESSGPEFRDERDYINEFQGWPNITIRYVTAEGRGPFDQLADQSFAPLILRNPSYYLAEELEGAAFAEGARFLLSGLGGEFGPTLWGKRHLPEMLIRFRWITLGRELRAARRVRKISPFRLMGSEIRTMLFPQCRAVAFSYLNPDLARECDAKPVLLNRWPHHLRFETANLRRWMLGHEWRGAFGIMRHAYPFLDRRVVDYCLSMPGEFVVREGVHRSLIRGALRGILPERIRQRTDKLPFSADYAARFREQIALARSFASQIGPRDPVRNIVNVSRLIQTLDGKDPLGSSRFAGFEIPMACYLIAFLRQFPEFQL